MPLYYLDDKHRRGEAFLVHHLWCLFRRKKALLLGEFPWPSAALEAASLCKRNVDRCLLCCPPRTAKMPNRRPNVRAIMKRMRSQLGPFG